MLQILGTLSGLCMGVCTTTHRASSDTDNGCCSRLLSKDTTQFDYKKRGFASGCAKTNGVLDLRRLANKYALS